MAYTPYGGAQGVAVGYDANGNPIGYTTSGNSGNYYTTPSYHQGGMPHHGNHGGAADHSHATAAALSGGGGAQLGYYTTSTGQQVIMDPNTGQFYAAPESSGAAAGYNPYGNGNGNGGGVTPAAIELSAPQLYGNSGAGLAAAAAAAYQPYGAAAYSDPGPPVSSPAAATAGLTYTPPSGSGGKAVSPSSVATPSAAPNSHAALYTPGPTPTAAVAGAAYVDHGAAQPQQQHQPSVFHAATVTVTRPNAVSTYYTARIHYIPSYCNDALKCLINVATS
jgi:hypothetical protein